MASYFAVIGSTHQCANLRRTTNSTHDKFLPADIVQVVNELPDSEFSVKDSIMIERKMSSMGAITFVTYSYPLPRLWC
ncbi:unnamed protein product [Rhizophagus irregularis]|nr:unnamed protein product [Rhizophagus irregularis]